MWWGLLELLLLIFCCDLSCGTLLLVQDFSWPEGTGITSKVTET